MIWVECDNLYKQRQYVDLLNLKHHLIWKGTDDKLTWNYSIFFIYYLEFVSMLGSWKNQELRKRMFKNESYKTKKMRSPLSELSATQNVQYIQLIVTSHFPTFRVRVTGKTTSRINITLSMIMNTNNRSVLRTLSSS